MRFYTLVLMLICVKFIDLAQKPKTLRKPRDILQSLKKEDKETGKTCYFTFNKQKLDCVVISD